MITSNNFYEALCLIQKANSLTTKLEWMAHHAQSVILNYGKDNQMWECSWIVGDKRFTSVSDAPHNAVRDILILVRTEILTKNA